MDAARQALAAAESGWAVFPCRAGCKSPAPGLRWRERSTSDPERVRAYVDRVPDANWACDLSKSGLLVIDVDCKRVEGDGHHVFDRAGYDSLLELLVGHDDDPTPNSTAATGSGGMHWWLRQPNPPVPGRTSRGFMPGIDVKSVGGYVLLPGCFVPPCIDHYVADGHYRAENPPLEPQEAPSWLIEAIVGTPRPKDPYEAATAALRASRAMHGGFGSRLTRLCDDLASIRPPGRNEALNTAAFKLRGDVEAGLIGVHDAVQALMGACRRNGLLDEDGQRACLATIDSGLGRSR